MSNIKTCSKCNFENPIARYFCANCGFFLMKDAFTNQSIYEKSEFKIMRIMENLKYTPHNPIIWDDMVDLYAKKIERYKALFELPEIKEDKTSSLSKKMEDFLDCCYNPEFQIAFVGTIKTGKSTLINALLGHNYASMAVTPETAALTKFRSSSKDYVHIIFYSQNEWKKLWASRSSNADAFMKEYNELNAEQQRPRWVGHAPIHKEIANSAIKQELAIWSSSKSAEHYFVKEIEVGISNLPSNYPKQVVFVDTPGLSDPVAYRSEITKEYIRKANAVFVCVDAQKLYKEEIETISSVFSFSSHNKSKVHVIATHWDKLNNPEEDWKEQKSYFFKTLVGKGFFDTREMADKNITYSSAYIYNLCRDYHNLDTRERTPLLQFALAIEQVKQKISSFDIDNATLSELSQLTNITHILELINDNLLTNYQALLLEDIKAKYADIIFNLKRITTEGKQENAELIKISNADIEEMKKKIAEQKRNYDEIMESRTQLLSVLSSVEKNTQARLNNILKHLEEAVK